MKSSITQREIEETQDSFLTALSALSQDPSPHVAAIRPKGCDADFLRDLVAADHYDQTPQGTQPLTFADSHAAFGAYAGTLAGLAISRSNIPTSVIDDMLDNHDYDLRDRVLFMAAEALGLSPAQANDLFLEHIASPDVEIALIRGDVNYHHAAGVFSNFLQHGKIDWSAIL